jgi:hypothetical protein
MQIQLRWGLLFLLRSHLGFICVRDEGEWYRRQLSPATIEVRFDIVWVEAIAPFLEKNCLTKGKLLTVAFCKSRDPFACAPHAMDDVFKGRWLPFGLSPQAKPNKCLLLF